MLGISKLLCQKASPADAIRYQRDVSKLPPDMLRFADDAKPIVVWNMTRQCNLHCIHCYAHAKDQPFEGELSTEEARAFIDDLAEFGAPVILFSGGEPLIRPDLFELGAYAKGKGLRPVISTNGTLIDEEAAVKIKEAGFQYVGISIDGLPETNDKFRVHEGAFDEAMRGLHFCHDNGVRTGIRFTLTRRNYKDLPEIMELMEKEGVPRFCMYHLVYTGRGSSLIDEDVPNEEKRDIIDFLFDKALEYEQTGRDVELLTVDNHCDNVYLYLTLKKEDPARAEEVMELLKMQGGNGSGYKIADVDNMGGVHADQFWSHYTFGNIRERKFSEIWTDLSDPVMYGLRHKKEVLKGRCGDCKWQDICGGFRVRAEAVYGDIWHQDPACYLTDEEIGIA
jgi:radical SAM protein with 4Fe4S-binding SPASM domain